MQATHSQERSSCRGVGVYPASRQVGVFVAVECGRILHGAIQEVLSVGFGDSSAVGMSVPGPKYTPGTNTPSMDSNACCPQPIVKF